MEKQNLSPSQYQGKVIFSWMFPEFVSQKRTKAWYFTAGLVIIGLLIYAIFTVNFLFVIIIVLTTMVWLIQNYKKPENIKCVITTKGVKIDKNF